MITDSLSNCTKVSIYIHFPFCLKKCLYCSFNSVAESHFPPERYVTALIREMELCRANLGQPVVAHTLYFGGGTPSLMDPGLIGAIVDSAADLFSLVSGAEITLESNPGALTLERLSGYRSCGVNRISLGVQSFHDAFLQRLGRVHSVEQAVEAFAAARGAGFDNIGVDLINSLPGQTVQMWEEDLRKAVDLQPEHISVYGLTVEDGTPFAEMEKDGSLILPDEDDAAVMFEKSAEILCEAGFEQYEIANFARPGFRSRHNQGYWLGYNYLGFGAGAHSFMRETGFGVRWRNPDDIEAYRQPVMNGELPWLERCVLTSKQAIQERLFLGLRLREGVDLEAFRTEFGVTVAEKYGREYSSLLDRGILEIQNGRLRIADQSLIIANEIFLRFM
jgi:oxygen-independent coproporphyrinogen III oxidase